MHQPSLSQLVYNRLFPKPRANDPSSFAAFITHNLVPEVRVETSTFYGTIDCIEAQYPGLDYSFPPHRMRLGRFQWHRRLFKAFDELGLTEAEIGSLCRWEGTKSARDRYEREEAVKVRDTTADDVRPASPPIPPSVYIHSYEDGAAQSEQSREKPQPAKEPECTELDVISELQCDGEDEETSDDDDEVESYGVALNQRLLEATAARQRGVNVSLDPDWEQWLKEVVERGGYTNMINAIRAGEPLDFFASMDLPSPSASSTSTTVPASQGASRSTASRPRAVRATNGTLTPQLAPLTPRTPSDSASGAAR
ncbi:hypothetical protein FQN52_007648 [Onygenales sp. PD_12]|nr:hypothetical protein FQN52_007648 [Onygenales sp. PD_12]